MAASFDSLSPDELTRRLTYAGLVLVGFEILKSMIVGPIKAFYANRTVRVGMPFKSYEDDVRIRARDEFEACLLYLRDFMKAISQDDVDAIQELRRHRNELAHDLMTNLTRLSHICASRKLFSALARRKRGKSALRGCSAGLVG